MSEGEPNGYARGTRSATFYAFNTMVNPEATPNKSLQHGSAMNVAYGDGSVRSVAMGEYLDTDERLGF